MIAIHTVMIIYNQYSQLKDATDVTSIKIQIYKKNRMETDMILTSIKNIAANDKRCKTLALLIDKYNGGERAQFVRLTSFLSEVIHV